MSKKLFPLVLTIAMTVTMLLIAPFAGAQQDDGLALVIPRLFGPDGLTVESESNLPDGSNHSAHFNSAFQTEFTQFNIALASQLGAIPIPSPASGFTYEFDAASGAFTRSTQSFGPILAERAETIGRGKFNIGFNFQHFGFEEIEGLDLGALPAVFTHDGAAPGGRADVVTTVNAIDVSLSQFTAFFSYGIADRVDLSVGIPIVSVDLSVASDATVQRLGTCTASDCDLSVHFYDEGPVHFGDHKPFTNSGSASGIGDILVRLKGTAYKSGATGIGLGVDVRLPTGNEIDLLGTGAIGFKPFFALSFANEKVSPHVNLGYQFNGDSVLAGDVETGTKAGLPDQFSYAVGADIAVHPRFTVALDLLGVRVIDSPTVFEEPFTGLDEAQTTFPNIVVENCSFNITSAAVGFKANVSGQFLFNFNVLFRLDSGGLKDTVTPLFGIEYGF